VRFAKPDVIVHEMTDLKDASDLLHFDRAFAASNRLRTEGTDHLLAAARDMGVRRFVAQSFCGWPYARIGGAVNRRTIHSIPNRRESCAAHWMLSGTWNRRSCRHPRSVASCSDMARSTVPIPVCSTGRSHRRAEHAAHSRAEYPRAARVTGGRSGADDDAADAIVTA
jgi:hypothetical protein